MGSRWTRWVRHEPIDPPAGFATPRLGKYQSTDFDPNQATLNMKRPLELDEKPFGVTANLGGFTGIGLAWGGTSREDARDSFLEFLNNDEEFGIQHWPKFRSIYVRFYGQNQLLTFRRDWVSGFTVS